MGILTAIKRWREINRERAGREAQITFFDSGKPGAPGHVARCETCGAHIVMGPNATAMEVHAAREDFRLGHRCAGFVVER